MAMWCRYWLGWGLVVAVLLVLCGPYLSSPLFFDDVYFFQPGNPQKFYADGWRLYPRWWVHWTFASTYVWFGGEVFWLRLGNLLVHLFTALLLGKLVQRVLSDIAPDAACDLSPRWSGFVVAILFVFHPLGIFAQGYLIQRTTLFATFFSLLSLYFFCRGLRGERIFLLGSVLAYVLSVLAKEHAIMLPVVAFLFLFLFRQSRVEVKRLADVWLALVGQLFIAFCLALYLRGMFGQPYEPLLAEVLAVDIGVPREHLYPLSVLNQMTLFFKYMLLWILPDPSGVSVDVRVPFPIAFTDTSVLMGALAFVVYMVLAVCFLWCGGKRGVVGLGMLAPAVLYFSELAVVRLQEPFVIYRSYLWAPLGFLSVSVLIGYFRFRVIVFLVVCCMLFFVGFDVLRLKTFSHPVLVWREAADVYERQSSDGSALGGYRIYYNLGTELHALGMVDLAMKSLDRSIELNPRYAWSRINKGSVYLGLHDYASAQEQYLVAIELLPRSAIPLNGLAAALEGQGRIAEAKDVRRVACRVDSRIGCVDLK